MTQTATETEFASKPLPKDFIPSENDVICGWARQNYHHAGNSRLRDMIRCYVPAYLMARTKTEKGKVIMEIVARLRRESPRGIGLVRQNPKNGRWYFIGTEKAKDKIGHALRKAAQQGIHNNGKRQNGGGKKKKIRGRKQGLDSHPVTNEDGECESKSNNTTSEPRTEDAADTELWPSSSSTSPSSSNHYHCSPPEQSYAPPPPPHSYYPTAPPFGKYPHLPLPPCPHHGPPPAGGTYPQYWGHYYPYYQYHHAQPPSEATNPHSAVHPPLP